MNPLAHLLSPSYLYAQNFQPEGRLSALTVAWALGLGLAAFLAWRWRGRAGGAAPWPALSLYGALGGVLLVMARPFVAGVLSARVWSVGCTALVGLALSAHGAEWAAGRLAWRPRPTLVGAWLMVHAAGLALLSVRWERHPWPVLVAGGCLLVASMDRPRRLRAGVLAPLLPAYASGLAVLFVEGALSVDLGPYRAFPYADPWSPLLHPPTMLAAGEAGAALLALASLAPARETTLRVTGTVLAGLSALWFVAAVGAQLSSGATGSDPYCYLQMAADLAERGTPLHRFPLLALAQREGLPTWPVVHVGYHPVPGGEMAATVWPVGWPVLLAPLHALAGEPGALWGAPLWALVSAALTYRAAGALWPDLSRGERSLAGGLAVFVLLTSLEGLLRSLVPMADAAAQALAVGALLALTLAHSAHSRGRALGWAAAAGAALGLGYWVRHPQLPLVLMAPVLLLDRRRPWSWRLASLAACGAGAALAALPDLLYHAGVFGSWLAAESPEAHLISPANIPLTLAPMLREALRRSEFGYLAPLALVGLAAQWRERASRPMAGAMLGGFLAVAALNLSYAPVRLRDLLGLFPWVALWSAWGVVALLRSARSAPWMRVAAAAVVLALSARVIGILGVPGHPTIWTFGMVHAEERAEFARLAGTLPPSAVVLTGLNSGAVERYTARSTVRPATLTEGELRRLIAALEGEGYVVYALDDGEEMEEFVARWGEGRLEDAGAYGLPVMARGGHALHRPARLYRLP